MIPKAAAFSDRVTVGGIRMIFVRHCASGTTHPNSYRAQPVERLGSVCLRWLARIEARRRMKCSLPAR
jgi:hypothetical protein